MIPSGINNVLILVNVSFPLDEKGGSLQEKKDSGPGVRTPAFPLCPSLTGQAPAAHATPPGLTHKTKELVCISSKWHFHSKFHDSMISKYPQSMIPMSPYICI